MLSRISVLKPCYNDPVFRMMHRTPDYHASCPDNVLYFQEPGRNTQMPSCVIFYQSHNKSDIYLDFNIFTKDHLLKIKILDLIFYNV